MSGARTARARTAAVAVVGVVLTLAAPVAASPAAAAASAEHGIQTRGDCGYQLTIAWQATTTADTTTVDGSVLASGSFTYGQRWSIASGAGFSVAGRADFQDASTTPAGRGFQVDAWGDTSFVVRDSRGRVVERASGWMHYVFVLDRGRVTGVTLDGPHTDEDFTGCIRAGRLVGTGSAKRLTEHPVGTTASELGYVEYLPPSYRKQGGSGSPLLVFLHGYGESGAGTAEELPLLYGTGLPQLIDWNGWPAERPFVVLAPQNPWETDDSIYDDCLSTEQTYLGSCLMRAQHDNDHPVDGAYCLTPDEVHAFVQYAIRTYNVDPKRVYVTGLSCGGFAAWEYASEHGDEVAAVVPIAGEGRPAWESAGCRLARVPIWAFHGLVDDTVDPQGSIQPVRGLRSCRGAGPGTARVTLYPDADHDSWTRTYDLTAGHDIYRWLLGFRAGT